MIHLRFNHPDRSGSKDWSIQANDDGSVTTYYGKTGSRMRETVAAATKVGLSPQIFIDKRVAEKLAKGYVVVDMSPDEKKRVYKEVTKRVLENYKAETADLDFFLF